MYVITLFTLLPHLVFGAGAPSDFKGFVAMLIDLIDLLVILTFTLTFIAFLWGVVKGWIINGESTEGVESGKKVVIVGIIAFVIMISIWGILTMLQSSLFGP